MKNGHTAGLWTAMGIISSLLVACAPPDFKAAVKPASITVKQGGETTMVVSIERDEKFRAPVNVVLQQLPGGLQATPTVIPEGKSNATIRLTATTSAPLNAPATASLMFNGEKRQHEVPVQIAVRPLAGSLDKAFGNDGTVRMKLGIYLNRDHANALAVQRDGKLLIGGQKNGHFTIYRMLPNGKLDTSFGTQGIMEASSATGTVFSLLVLGDGGIVAVGGEMRQGGPLVLARLTSDGKIDPTFGKKGVTVHKFNDYDLYGVEDAAVQSDGRIIIAGEAGNNMGGSGGITDPRPLMARFNENGSVDQTFGSGGKVVGGPQEYGVAHGLALGPNDTLFITGGTYSDWSNGDWTRGPEPTIFYLARYLNDGTPDASFGNNGYVTYTRRNNNEETTGASGSDVTVLSDGKILTVGNSWSSNESSFGEINSIRVARYLPDGARDMDFGEDGMQLIDYGYSASAQKLIASPDGYLVLGDVQPEESASSAPSLIRLTKEGQPDPAFNFDGRVGVGTLGNALGIAVLKSGQIISGTRLSPYFQDYDDNDDAAKINLEIIKINP